jgi:hypothetical protein
MAWRFKASKYKNAVPVEPKLDKQIRDLSIGKIGVLVPLQGYFAVGEIAFMWMRCTVLVA